MVGTCSVAQCIAANERGRRDRHQVHVLLRIARPLEHVQHALGDGEAAADVDGRLHTSHKGCRNVR